jgi:3-vinyl bacteriochlorophyllide hydratase
MVHSSLSKLQEKVPLPAGRRPLYTAEERVRRDKSIWTFVQGLLAPIQFFIFLGKTYYYF